jgi:hypothetical protein
MHGNAGWHSFPTAQIRRDTSGGLCEGRDWICRRRSRSLDPLRGSNARYRRVEIVFLTLNASLHYEMLNSAPSFHTP